MSLQTLTLNCLACHILAKHPRLTKNNKEQRLIALKTEPVIPKIKQPTILANKEYKSMTKPTKKNPLRKIA